jgi:hypothetical protein
MHGVIVGLLQWHPLALVLAMMVVSCLVGAAIHAVIVTSARRWRRRHAEADSSSTQAEERRDFHGPFLGIVGVVYAVVLGFVVVTAWQEYGHVQEIAMRERDDVTVLDVLAGTYSTPGEPQAVATDDAKLQLQYYAAYMADESAEMFGGVSRLCLSSISFSSRDISCYNPDRTLRSSAQANLAFECLTNDLVTLSPQSERQRSIYDRILEQVRDLQETRDDRRHLYKDRLPAILWIVLFLGGMITIAVTYLGDWEDRSQLLRTLALSAMIGMMLSLSLVFDHPFTRHTNSDSDAWQDVHYRLSRATTVLTPLHVSLDTPQSNCLQEQQ